MKKLTIYQENCEPVVLFDKDDIDLEQYIKQTDEIFHSQTISTLHTTEGSLSLRPGKLLSIMVEDVSEFEIDENLEDILKEEAKKEPEVKPKRKPGRPKKKPEQPKEEIDIIKDAD